MSQFVNVLLVLVAAACSCAFVIGVMIGWDRGRKHAEESLRVIDLRDDSAQWPQANARWIWPAEDETIVLDEPTIYIDADDKHMSD